MTFAKRYERDRMPPRNLSSLARLAVAICLVSSLNALSAAVEPKKPADPNLIMWTDPGDIKSKNLFYGPGGEENQPKLPVTFIKEDLNGHSPKFDVRDAAGKKWKAKMDIEAHTEPVASRLVWAVGYLTNENYFYSRKKWFFGVLAFSYMMDSIDTLLKGKQYAIGFGAEFPLRNTIHFILCIVAIKVNNKKFHAALVILFLLYELSFILRLYNTQ